MWFTIFMGVVLISAVIGASMWALAWNWPTWVVFPIAVGLTLAEFGGYIFAVMVPLWGAKKQGRLDILPWMDQALDVWYGQHSNVWRHNMREHGKYRNLCFLCTCAWLSAHWWLATAGFRGLWWVVKTIYRWTYVGPWTVSFARDTFRLYRDFPVVSWLRWKHLMWLGAVVVAILYIMYPFARVIGAWIGMIAIGGALIAAMGVSIYNFFYWLRWEAVPEEERWMKISLLGSFLLALTAVPVFYWDWMYPILVAAIPWVFVAMVGFSGGTVGRFWVASIFAPAGKRSKPFWLGTTWLMVSSVGFGVLTTFHPGKEVNTGAVAVAGIVSAALIIAILVKILSGMGRAIRSAASNRVRVVKVATPPTSKATTAASPNLMQRTVMRAKVALRRTALNVADWADDKKGGVCPLVVLTFPGDPSGSESTEPSARKVV